MSALRAPSADDVQVENAQIALNAISDIVDDLRVQIYKMRQDTRDAIEHIRCYEDCGTTTDGLAKALQEGWIDPGVDETDDDAYVAWCPACQATHEQIEKVLNTPAPKSVEPKQKPNTLFD